MPKELTLPHNQDAEETVLGCILKEPMAYVEVAKTLTDPQMFFSPKCRLIYECMTEMVLSNEAIDIVPLADELSKWECKPHASALEAIGGRSYLSYLTNDIVSAANIGKYAQIVAEKYQYRKIISLAGELQETAYSQSSLPAALIAEASQKLLRVAEQRDDRFFRKVSSYGDEILEHLQLVTTGKKPTGIPFGFERLDHATAGAQKADFIVIGGRPSQGKTALLDNMAQNQATLGYSVGVFSAETKGSEYSLRTLCTRGHLDSMKLKRGQMSADDWDKLTKAHSEVVRFKYYVDDTAAIDINSLMAKAAKGRDDLGLDIIYIDYIQKLRYPSHFPNKREATNYVVASLKNLAKSLDIPICGLSQLNRNLEMRQYKAPILSDFKESGDIEQEADLILGIWRPEHYIKTKKKGENKYQNLAEVLILKQRNGPLDIVPLYFNKYHTRFENMAADHQTEYPEVQPF